MRSRAVIHGTSGAPRPSRAANPSNNGNACAPQNSIVPSAPPSCTTSTRGRSCASRSWCRASSDAHTAALNPNVIGSPGWPWVRPHITVSRWRRASATHAARQRATSRSTTSPTRFSTQPNHVSERSCTVAP